MLTQAGEEVFKLSIPCRKNCKILANNYAHTLSGASGGSTAGIATHRHHPFQHLLVPKTKSPGHPLQPPLAQRDGGSHTWREGTSLAQTSGAPKLSARAAQLPATQQGLLILLYTTNSIVPQYYTSALMSNISNAYWHTWLVHSHTLGFM